MSGPPIFFPHEPPRADAAGNLWARDDFQPGWWVYAPDAHWYQGERLPAVSSTLLPR